MEGPKLVVLTGMVAPEDTRGLWESWRATGREDWLGVVCLNGNAEFDRADITAYARAAETSRELLELAGPSGVILRRPEILGTVAAFRQAFAFIPSIPQAEPIVALLHDDLEIMEVGWDRRVLDLFKDPAVGMVGFGGAKGVGAEGMYDRPFDPMTLARHRSMSNMRDAEAHGERTTRIQQVAVLDGFSLIGRWRVVREALQILRRRQVVHHAYDVAFGAVTRRMGLKTILLPIACHHAGGRTAVGNPRYADWAAKNLGGDQAVWTHAHRQVWEEFKDQLPFWVL